MDACISALGNTSECFHDEYWTGGGGINSHNLCLSASVEHGHHFESLLPVSQRLAAGRAIRIVTLGGSVPYGNNCIRPNGDHHRDCSWPARLVQALRHAYPASKIAHDNLASGGNGVVHILSTAGIVLREPTDVILLDTLVNDAWRSGSSAASQALEEFIRVARVLAPTAALLVVEAAAPGLGDEVQVRASSPPYLLSYFLLTHATNAGGEAARARPLSHCYPRLEGGRPGVAVPLAAWPHSWHARHGRQPSFMGHASDDCG